MKTGVLILKVEKKGCFIKEIGKDLLHLYTFGSDLEDNVPILFFLSLRGSFSHQLSYSLIFILFYSLVPFFYLQETRLSYH